MNCLIQKVKVFRFNEYHPNNEFSLNSGTYISLTVAFITAIYFPPFLTPIYLMLDLKNGNDISAKAG